MITYVTIFTSYPAGMSYVLTCTQTQPGNSCVQQLQVSSKSM